MRLVLPDPGTTARRVEPGPPLRVRVRWESPAYGGRLGACHGLELPFVFDSLHDPGPRAFVGADPPKELAAAVSRAWTPSRVPVIPGGRRTRPGRRAVARFGAGADLGWEVIDDPRADLRELWGGIR